VKGEGVKEDAPTSILPRGGGGRKGVWEREKKIV